MKIIRALFALMVIAGTILWIWGYEYGMEITLTGLFVRLFLWANGPQREDMEERTERCKSGKSRFQERLEQMEKLKPQPKQKGEV